MTATIDEALELLEDSGPEFDNGLSNHGPMAAEALVTLGRSGAMIPWVERYKQRLQGRPSGRNPIDPSEWWEALGDYSRVADWGAFFERELVEWPWRQVVGEWVPVLAPGLVAAAMHGIIRTAHAARSLEEKRHHSASTNWPKGWGTGPRDSKSYRPRRLSPVPSHQGRHCQRCDLCRRRSGSRVR